MVNHKRFLDFQNLGWEDMHLMAESGPLKCRYPRPSFGLIFGMFFPVGCYKCLRVSVVAVSPTVTCRACFMLCFPYARLAKAAFSDSDRPALVSQTLVG